MSANPPSLIPASPSKSPPLSKKATRFAWIPTKAGTWNGRNRQVAGCRLQGSATTALPPATCHLQPSMQRLYSLLYTLAFIALLPYFAYQAIFNRKYLGNLRGRLWLSPELLN